MFWTDSDTPFVIAELSANHGGSIERAKNSILAAKNSGANAVKIQTYTPDTMTLDLSTPPFLIESGLWAGKTLYELYQEAHTPYEWHEELFAFARANDILLFSSAFDSTAIELLESVGTPAYKIASFELTDLPLIKQIADTGKPILMSTGMASIGEVADAVNVAFASGAADVLLFHCISHYPAELSEAQLSNLTVLKREFGLPVGLSDHTTDNRAAIMAIALGAVAIEKHFKLDDDESGPDSSFSINPAQLANLVEDCRISRQAMGQPSFSRPLSEEKSFLYRRSLYFVSNLKAGSVISESDVRILRPNLGLPPKDYSSVVGSKLLKDVSYGDPVERGCLEDK